MLANRDRNAWRALPLQFIVSENIDAPKLAFDECDQLDATMLRADIDDLYVRWRKAWDPEKKRGFALRLRRQWLKLCTLAIGIRFTGSRTVWGFSEPREHRGELRA